MLKRILPLVILAAAVCFFIVHFENNSGNLRRDSDPGASGEPAAVAVSSTGDAGHSAPAIPRSNLSAATSAESKLTAAFAPAKGTSEDDPPTQLARQIRELLNSGDEGQRNLVLTNLLLELVALNPAVAGKLAESIVADAGRRDVLRTVAQAWADKDSSAALAWAAQLADEYERRNALSDVTIETAKSAPEQAIDMAQQYHLNEGANDLLPTLAVQWADKDLSGALSWAAKQPAGDQRNEILSRLAFIESQTAPVDAANMVLAEIPAGSVQQEAVLSVLHQWSLKDLAAASAWVEAFPDGGLKTRAQNEMLAISRNQASLAAGSATRP
ncbi:MAG TPA: hypothetical protein VF988_04460 [Verrucomicrobiae bacterium]